MRPSRSLLIVAFALSLGVTCQPDAVTQVVVVIHTDMTVPGELDEVRIRVWGPSSDTPVRDQSVDLGFVSLPTDFVVRPRDDDASRTITIQLDALRSGTLLFDTRAVTAFSQGRETRLDMYLARRCVTEAVTCKASETCRRDGCVPEYIDPDSLPSYGEGSSKSSWPVVYQSQAGAQIWGLARNLDGVYAVGSFKGTIPLPDGELTAKGDESAFVFARSESGDPRWVYTLTSTKLANLRAVGVEPNGNVDVAGNLLEDIVIGTEAFAAGDRQDALVVSLSPLGDPLRARSFDDANFNAQAQALAVSSTGDLALAGVHGSCDFGGGPLTPPTATDGSDAFVAVLDPAWNHVWSRTLAGPGVDIARGVAFGANGDLYVCGGVTAGADFGDGVAQTVNGEDDVFLAHYSPTGVLQNVVVFGSAGSDHANAITVTPTGSVVIAGIVTEATTLGGVPLGEAGGGDAFVAAFDAALALQWIVPIGTANPDVATSLTTLGDRIVALASVPGGLTLGGVSFSTPVARGGVALGISSAGVPSFALPTGASDDIRTSIVAASDGARVFVAGRFSGAAVLSGKQVTAKGPSDAYWFPLTPP